MFDFASIPKFCINLARRPDRREHSVKEFTKHNLDVEFVTAIDANDIILPELSCKSSEYYAKGNWACVLSHLSIIKRMTSEYVFICEDDIQFCHDFLERLKIVEQSAPEFDLFYFGGGYKDGFGIGDGFHRARVMTGTWSYILRKNAAEFIARNITYDWGPDQFYSDVVLSRFRGLTYLPMLAQISAAGTISDIGGPGTA